MPEQGVLRGCAWCRLGSVVNYCLKVERELWGLLGGPWDGPNPGAYRSHWGQQVSLAQGVGWMTGWVIGLLMCSMGPWHMDGVPNGVAAWHAAVHAGDGCWCPVCFSMPEMDVLWLALGLL